MLLRARISLCFWFLCSGAWARVGYFNPLEVPVSLTPKMQSVYRLVLLSNEPVKEMTKEDYQLALADRRGVEKRLVQEDWAKCQMFGRRTCPDYLRGHGTAFLAGDGRTLWTARHNIQHFVDEYQAKRELLSNSELIRQRADIPLVFLLYDKDEHLVFDTRRPTDRAELDFYVPRDCPNIMVCSETDVVSLRLNRDLESTPLRFTQGSPQVGETVYAVGFPKETSDRDRKGRVPNSDGQSIYVSLGATIAPRACDRAAGLHIDPLAIDRNLLFFDADVVGGNSGGPVFDQMGGVVSVVIGNWCRSPTSPDNYSGAGAVGLRPEWLQSLRDKWSNQLRAILLPAVANLPFK